MVQTTATTGIRTFASYTPKNKSLFVYIVNKTSKAESVNIGIKNYAIKGVKQSGQLVGSGPDDTKPVFKKNTIGNNNDTQLIPGNSITVIEYSLQ